MTVLTSILYSPSDSGYITDFEMIFDFLSANVSAGIRHFNGNEQSVYGQLPITSQLYFTAYGSF